MRKTTNKAHSLQMTRREFVGRTLLTAGAIAGAPAFLRGQNLNNKLNIAFIACGGRANASLSELTLLPGRPASDGKKDGKKGKNPTLDTGRPETPHPHPNAPASCHVNPTAP